MRSLPFDRSKPFYPIVVSYICQLIGYKELAIRGMFGAQSMNDILSCLIAVGAPTSTWSKDKLESLTCDLNVRLGALQFKSEWLGDSITLDIDDIAGEITGDLGCLGNQMTRTAGNVLVLAHEVSKGKPWHDQGPLWEFLRHCSNTASHGGVFHFLDNEPQCVAQWGRFEITRALQGTPLFKRGDGTGMLSLGDPLPLLWEIEQAFPMMS